MDNGTSHGSHTCKLFNKPKKNLIQLIDFVGAVDNSLNDKNYSYSSDNVEVNEIDQTSALVSGIRMCKLYDSPYYYTYKFSVRL